MKGVSDITVATGGCISDDGDGDGGFVVVTLVLLLGPSFLYCL